MIRIILTTFLFLLITDNLGAKEGNNQIEINYLHEKIEGLTNSESKNTHRINQVILTSELNKNNVENVNMRVSDLSFSLNFYSILITLIIIIYTVFHYISSKTKLEASLQEMKEINNQAKNKLKEINSSHIHINHAEDKITNIFSKLSRDLQISGKDKQIINNINAELDDLAIKDYGFDAWWARFLSAYIKDDFEEAIYFLNQSNNIENLSINEKSKVLLSQGVIYGKMHNTSKEIKQYNKIITLLRGKSDPELRRLFGSALVKKSLALSLKGKIKKAIAVNNETIRIFHNDHDKSLQIKVVKALLNNMELTLITNGRVDETQEKLFLDLSINHENDVPIFKMLKIFESLIKEPDKTPAKFKKWKSNYEDTILEWRFDELEQWALSQNKEYREQIIIYLNEFKACITDLKIKFN